MNGNGSDKDKAGRGLLEEEDDNNERLDKKPLYIWAKSFAQNESSSSKEEEDSLKSFVRGNALSHALEYIGIGTELEQSSLHLSAIFDEESQQQQSMKSKFPNHYESETKNRIQSLNRTFTELKAYFEDHFSQLVAIKPPNAVHIVSACPTCSVQELEKILLLLFGAAIKGAQKQDTIKKIKRLPPDTQEALIEHIKTFTDNPEVLQLRSWSEFANLGDEEKQKVYESLLSLARRLLLDRNQGFQTQLMSDYFSGYMYCGQRKIYDGGKGFGESELLDDARLSAALRQLKEELHEKTELLQDCREELEVTKSRLQEMQDELGTTHKELRSCKQARDELDALREGQEKALRLEAELEKLKKKLQSYEQCYEQVEKLQDENRSLVIQNESLLEQNSFLTIEKESLRLLINNEPVLDLNSKLYDDEDSNAAVEDLNMHRHTPEIDFDSDSELLIEPIKPTVPETVEVSTSMDSVVTVDEPLKLDAETLTVEEDFPQQVTNPDEDDSSTVLAEKSPKRTRRRRGNMRVKRTKTIFLPLQGAQKLVPMLADVSSRNQVISDEKTVAIKLIKVCHASGGSPKRKLFTSRSSWLQKAAKRRHSRTKNTLADMENDADEELSISPNGPPNLSDIENCPSPLTRNLETVQEDQLFFMSRIPSDQLNSKSFVERSFIVNGNDEHDTSIPLVQISQSNGLYMNSLEVPLHDDDCLRRPSHNVSFTFHLPDNVDDDQQVNDPSICPCNSCSCNNQDQLPNNNSHILNVNMVENYSTHVNLNLSHIYNQNNDHHYDASEYALQRNKDRIALALPTTVQLNSPQPSSSEDDDSIWYEYGCV